MSLQALAAMLRRRPTYWAFLFLVLCTSLEWTHAKPLDSVWANDAIKESGVQARSLNEHDLYWLDNERVIFVGWIPGEFRLEQGRRFPKIDLFVWNTTSGELRRHAELSTSARLCVVKRYVRVQFERDGKHFVRYGDYGIEHETELDLQAHLDGILAVSPISCREYNPKLLRKRYGERALPLLDRGEYLDRSSVDHAEPMRYFPEDGSDPIPLRIIPNRYVLPAPRYSDYLNKYVFNELRPRVGPDTMARAWTVDKQGRVEEIVLPQGLWMASTVRAMPIEGGWVMTSKATAIGRRVDAAGVYLVRGEKATRVMSGLPHAYAVSPNGCNVAVAIDVELEREARPMIRTINLCSRGE